MEPCSIQFIPRTSSAAWPPSPAARNMPEWLKQIPGEVVLPDESKPSATVKRCPPFVEAISFGYCLHVPADMLFIADANGALSVQSACGPIALMPPDAYAESAFARHSVVVFPILWTLLTPPGFSTLFLHPLNRADFPFRILSQSADTDRGQNPEGFPAISLIGPGQQFLLPAGTPFVQAVPVRRVDWQLDIGGLDVPRFAAQRNGLVLNPHYYKDGHWQKKGYT